MILRKFIGGCLLALALLPALSLAGDVSATLDRNDVQLGETVTLNVRVNGQGMGVAAPDLGALNRDFQILGNSQNSSYSMVNGKASAELIFGIALRRGTPACCRFPR